MGGVAEGAGFEPAIRLPVYTLSRRAPSTARPPLRAALLYPAGGGDYATADARAMRRRRLGGRDMRDSEGVGVRGSRPGLNKVHAMANTIRVDRIAGALGAEISGVDLSRLCELTQVPGQDVNLG